MNMFLSCMHVDIHLNLKREIDYEFVIINCTYGNFCPRKKREGAFANQELFFFNLGENYVVCNANRRIIALVVVENEFSYMLHLLGKKPPKTTILRSNKYTSLQ